MSTTIPTPLPDGSQVFRDAPSPTTVRDDADLGAMMMAKSGAARDAQKKSKD